MRSPLMSNNHRTCWTKHVVLQAATPSSTSTKSCPVNEKEIVAQVEYINLLNNLLHEGQILSIADAHDAYLFILRSHNCEVTTSRRTVRKLITENIADITFISTPRRNEADRLCMNSATIVAIEAALNEAKVDSDMKVIFQCATILRKVILQRI